MKFKTPNSNALQNTLASAVGVVVGGAVSDGLVGILPLSNKALSRGGLAAVSGIIASAIQGNKTADLLVKSTAMGATGQQLLRLIREQLLDKAPDASSAKAADKFLRGALGLGQPYEMYNTLARPVDPALWDAYKYVDAGDIEDTIDTDYALAADNSAA